MAALYWSLSSDYFDERDKDLLVGTYAGDGWAGDKENILGSIGKRAAILDNRRILWHHYEKANRGLGLD
jgi:hypothetical protein